MFIAAVNAFTKEAGKGLNVLTGEYDNFSKVARAYKAKGLSWIAVGDENYGEGSSREHAAMCPRFLGAKAVIAKSFARIHETNLKKQGVLGLTFATPETYEQIGEKDRLSIVGLKDFKPGKNLQLIIKKPDGSIVQAELKHTFTEEEIGWFQAGSAPRSRRCPPCQPSSVA